MGISVSGNGSAQTIRIVSEASTTQSNGRGAMIDNIAVTEVLPVNTGYKGSSIRLSSIVATASDTDGSENVSLQVSAIPAGATLTDGTRSFTASPSSARIDISQWQWDRISITAPTGFTGTFTLQVMATATEAANGDNTSTTFPLTVSVLPKDLASPIILDLNGDGVQTLDINADRVMTRDSRVFLFSPTQALLDVGRVLGAARFAQTGGHLLQRGFKTDRLFRVDGLIFCGPCRGIAIQQDFACRLTLHSLHLDRVLACGLDLGGKRRVELPGLLAADDQILIAVLLEPHQTCFGRNAGVHHHRAPRYGVA